MYPSLQNESVEKVRYEESPIQKVQRDISALQGAASQLLWTVNSGAYVSQAGRQVIIEMLESVVTIAHAALAATPGSQPATSESTST